MVNPLLDNEIITGKQIYNEKCHEESKSSSRRVAAAPVAEWVSSLNFSALNHSITGVGSSPALATSETSQVLLAGVSGSFPGVLPFRPTYRLTRLDMSEIILKGTFN